MLRTLLTAALSIALLTGAQAISITPGEEFYTLNGKIRDRSSNKPLIARVIVSTTGLNPIESTTDENGEFRINLPKAGEYKIVVLAPDYDVEEEAITVPLSDPITQSVEILLSPHIKQTLKGTIFSKKDNQPLEGELNVYLNSDFIKTDSKTLNDGSFSEPFLKFGWYLIEISAPGHQTVTDTFFVMNCKRKIIQRNYYLPPIENGLTIQLSNVNFDFNKATIDVASYAVLDRMAKFLQENPSVKVEVAGHTDNDGPDIYNLYLSQVRAEAVMNYLITKGISSARLSAKGYGKSVPIDTNTTAMGKARNRRVEIVVVSK
jgi:outer membrane protein OmpA-like peptidoglycan-associated protein